MGKSTVDASAGFGSVSYTHLDVYKRQAEKQPNGEMRDIQTQSIAIGDGLNYEKPACNPVLTQKDLPEGLSLIHIYRSRAYSSIRTTSNRWALTAPSSFISEAYTYCSSCLLYTSRSDFKH